jgi:acetyl esterase
MANDAAGPSRLDPEIAEFVRRMGSYWREHPPLASVSLPEARAIAERVRAHWRAGGPQMAATTDLEVPTAYGSVRIRLLDPTPQGPKPALVYLHGGGWTLFSIDTHDRLMREYAARAGVVAVGVDYALSPEARFPQAIEETVAVVRWLREHGARHGVDGARLAIGGDSAGAAMTIAACMMLRDAGDRPGIRAMLLNYGAFDEACSAPSYERFGRGGYLWDPGEMKAFWRNYMRDERDARDPLCCPAIADVRGLPPAFNAVPECDVMYDEAMAMGARLLNAGVAAQTVVYPGATHSFLEAVSIARISDRAFAEASRWLSDMLRQAG